MNVFHRYTRQALRKNRSRTWVTIVGIILSVALFTAVTEGAYSGVQYLVGAAEYTVGQAGSTAATRTSRSSRRRS